MDTLVTVYHCTNTISVAVHVCAGAPEDYISQTSGDVYNCLARFKRLNKKSEMLVISVRPSGPVYWSVNQESKSQDYVSALTELFLKDEKLLVDVIKVVHTDFKVRCYLPYFDLEVSPEVKALSMSLLFALSGKIDVNKMKSLIWEAIEIDKIKAETEKEEETEKTKSEKEKV
jgi:hypothetical protein